jgi:hypothetical protein
VRKNGKPNGKQQKRFPITCPWCEREGRPTIVGWSAVRGSHGICPFHKKALERQARELKAARRVNAE